ncbi:MAG: hypothetical protein KKA63_04720 [Gammaproteobacteria bacterium]|nr:hypothetical protein [Gammaproteobacteria bacterium]
MKIKFLSVLVTCSFLIQGCVSHSLLPDATRGKTFAIYPASIALTVVEKPEYRVKDVLKDVSVFVITTVATAGYAVVTPKSEPGQRVPVFNMGPPLMNEFALQLGRAFGMRKVDDFMPVHSSKSQGGQLTRSEVKSDYQNIADYLVQFDHVSNEFVGAFRLFYEVRTDHYFVRYLVTANIYDTKTGERLDWGVCSGEHGTATLADWFKDNGKLLVAGTQEVAAKCAEEMIHKLNQS